MSATVRLPRMLAEAVGSDATLVASGSTVAGVLDDLFSSRPGLRGHIIDETGAIRPHVAVFVNGDRAALDAAVPSNADIHVIHAVSGG